MIEDTVSGILIEPADPAALAAAIARLLDDRELWRTISINARRTAESYDISLVERRLSNIYSTWPDRRES